MTIPANEIVSVNPAVLGVGGTDFNLNGLFLTENWRIPTGAPTSFGDDTELLDFFGPGNDYNEGVVYFNGFDNKTQSPSALLYARYPNTSIGAYLLGGDVSGLSQTALQAISGTLSVVVDGIVHSTGAVDLSSASSFSAAASTLQTELNASLTQTAAFTGAISAQTSAFTASIAGNLMYVTAVASGSVVPGTIVAGTNVGASTSVAKQLSGTTGGIGVYALSGTAQNVVSESMTGSYGLLTVSAVASGTLGIGNTLGGAGVSANTEITGFNSGSGSTGTYYVNNTQTVASESMTATATALTVTYDSVSGGFLVSSGIVGAVSTMAYATGSAAAALMLTQVTGAVLSQGADATTPQAYMAGLVNLTQNWSTFTTMFDPDGGSGNTTQRLAFAQWNAGQNNRYCYVPWDTGLAPTTANPASSSLGYQIDAADYGGCAPVWELSGGHKAAFICGYAASIDFSRTNGRATAAFKSQNGLSPDVTDPLVAANLRGNFYNYYGAYAQADTDWEFLYPGTVTGDFLWLDSYLNQIWLNNNFVIDLMNLLKARNSIPYNAAGYALIAASLSDTINQALNAGVIRAGVPLSSSQILEVNQDAGVDIANVLQTRGWYLQVLPPTATVRAARGTPVVNFWYVDGESVQQITMASILLQ